MDVVATRPVSESTDAVTRVRNPRYIVATQAGLIVRAAHAAHIGRENERRVARSSRTSRWSGI